MVASPLFDTGSSTQPAVQARVCSVANRQARWILSQIQNGQVFTVDSKRRSGLILCKSFHAEFAGPGAAVGGDFDLSCKELFVIGDLSVQPLASYEDSRKSYSIRRAWNRLIHGFAEIESPSQRSRKILTQFELYFDKQTVAQIPDHIFALLVKVSPHVIQSRR